MSFSLVTLPTEVLQQILSIETRPSAIINLFICGNTHLQRKITALVAQLSLRSAGLFKNRRLPSCLTSMRNLRDLYLEIPSLMLYSPFNIFKVLKELSPTLSKLEIRFIKSWPKESDPVDPYDESPLDSEPSMFYDKLVEPLLAALEGRTSLEALHIHTRAFFRASDLRRLPTSLKDLTIRLPAHSKDTIAAAKALPSGLTRLVVTNGVRIDLFTAKFFGSLPRQLTSFEIAGYAQQLSLDEILLLPPFLRHTRAFYFKMTSPIVSKHAININRMVYDMPIPESPQPTLFAAFPYLLDLQIEGPPKMDYRFISTLPSSLTSLYGVFDMNMLEKAKWPLHLTSLKSHYCDGMTPAIASSLPSSLRTLIFQFQSGGANGAVVSALSRSITSLDMEILAMDEAIEFPPSLTSLVSFRCRFNLAKLPKHLTSCILPFASLKATSCAGLPPGLKNFSFRNLQLDYVPEEYREGLNELYDTYNKEHGFTESDPLFASLPTTPTINVFDLLPRSLDSLDFQRTPTHDQLSPADWNRLPQLQQLKVSGEIASDVILYLPSYRMTELRVCTPELRDEHIAALPRGLTYFGHFAPSYTLSNACIAHVPISISYLSLPQHFTTMAKYLQYRRYKAFAVDGPPSELKRLLTIDLITENDTKPTVKE